MTPFDNVRLVAHRQHPTLAESGSFESERDAALYYDLAHRCGFGFMEIYRMVMYALFGPEAIEPEFFAPLWDFNRELRQLERDNDRLRSAKPTLDELLAIRERALAAIKKALEITTDPIKRLELEAMLQPTETWQRVQQLAQRQLEESGDAPH